MLGLPKPIQLIDLVAEENDIVQIGIEKEILTPNSFKVYISINGEKMLQIYGLQEEKKNAVQLSLQDVTVQDFKSLTIRKAKDATKKSKKRR